MTTVNNFKKTNLLPDMESFKNPDNFMSKNLKRVNSLPNMESPQNSENPLSRNLRRVNSLPNLKSFKNTDNLQLLDKPNFLQIGNKESLDNFMSRNLRRVNSLPNMESPQNSENPLSRNLRRVNSLPNLKSFKNPDNLQSGNLQLSEKPNLCQIEKKNLGNFMTQELKHLDLKHLDLKQAYMRMGEITVKNEAYLHDIKAMKTLESINERIKIKARTLRNTNEPYHIDV